MIGRANVDIDHPVHRIGLERQRIADHRDAGVDDQYVERPLLGHHVDHLLPVGCIGPDRRRPGVGAQRLRGVMRSRISEGHVCAILHEPADDGRADTAAAADDEGLFGVKVSHVGLP